MSVSTVAVAGITGKLGTLISHAILTTSQASIRGLCRDKAKLAPELQPFSSRITLVEGSSSDLAAAREAVCGSQVVICCYLGSNELMTDGQKVLVDACLAESVPRYVASDYSLDYTKLELGDLPAKDPMIEVRAYLEGKPVAGVHVMIGCFTETFVQYLGVWNPTENLVKRWGTGDEVWDFTTYETCAAYVAAVALDPSAQGFLKFRADHITINEMVKVVARLRGGRGEPPNVVSEGSMDELKAKIDAARQKGQVGWDVMPLFYTYYMQNDQVCLGEDLDNARYPHVEPETLEMYLKRTSAF